MPADAEQTFKEGDVVQLNSGGPAMTIKVITEKPFICHCEWFDGNCNELKKGSFHAHMLKTKSKMSMTTT